MKKINLLLSVMIVVTMVSCGGKSHNKDESEETSGADKKEVKIADCNCSEVLTETNSNSGFKRKGSKDLYTGSCVEKDQYDSIIQKADFKNGWMVKFIKKIKINNEYVQTEYTEYENGEEINSWSIKFNENDYDSPNYKYITEYKESKNNKLINNWKIGLSEYEITGICIEGAIIYKDGKSLDDFPSHEKARPKSFPNPEYSMNFWRQNDISPDERDEILANLKKELPHFNYWKIK